MLLMLLWWWLCLLAWIGHNGIGHGFQMMQTNTYSLLRGVVPNHPSQLESQSFQSHARWQHHLSLSLSLHSRKKKTDENNHSNADNNKKQTLKDKKKTTTKSSSTTVSKAPATVVSQTNHSDLETDLETVLETEEDSLYTLSSNHSTEYSVPLSLAVEITDPVEYVITMEELKRVWKATEETTPFGMPDKKFSTKTALLLVGDNDSDDDDILLDGSRMEYVRAMDSDVSMTDDDWLETIQHKLNWTASDPRTPALIESLSEVYASLEEDDSEEVQDQLSGKYPYYGPDIDTQYFEGDFMQGGSKLTQRIPSLNYNPMSLQQSRRRKRKSVVSSEQTIDRVDKMFSSMTIAGEEDLDFTKRPSAWLAAGLSEEAMEELKQRQRLHSYYIEHGLLSIDSPAFFDWSQFNQTATEADLAAMAEEERLLKEQYEQREAEIAAENETRKKFLLLRRRRPTFNTVMGTNHTVAVRKSPWQLLQGPTVTPEMHERKLLQARDVLNNMTLNEMKKPEPFVVPEEWLNKPEFKDHVGYEIWSQPNPLLDYDDGEVVESLEDVTIPLLAAHIRNVTDLYLTNHAMAVKEIDEATYNQRYLQATLTNTPIVNDTIPLYLTPDLHRGVNYTNTVLEMKGKMVLEAYLPPPSVRFANDSFDYNNKIDADHYIGTVRDQYDWSPSDPTDFAIDDAVVEKLEPVLRFLNHAAELQSTKLRHIIGIRATVFAMAKQILPNLIDLRLETPRRRDPGD